MTRRKRKNRGFYERGAPTPEDGQATEQSGGGSSADNANLHMDAAAQTEDQDEREMRRQFRELLRRQPDDRRLLLQAARALMPKKPTGTNAEDLGERMRATLDLLGDQILPPDPPSAQTRAD